MANSSSVKVTFSTDPNKAGFTVVTKKDGNSLTTQKSPTNTGLDTSQTPQEYAQVYCSYLDPDFQLTAIENALGICDKWILKPWDAFNWHTPAIEYKANIKAAAYATAKKAYNQCLDGQGAKLKAALEAGNAAAHTMDQTAKQINTFGNQTKVANVQINTYTNTSGVSFKFNSRFDGPVAATGYGDKQVLNVPHAQVSVKFAPAIDKTPTVDPKSPNYDPKKDPYSPAHGSGNASETTCGPIPWEVSNYLAVTWNWLAQYELKQLGNAITVGPLGWFIVGSSLPNVSPPAVESSWAAICYNNNMLGGTLADYYPTPTLIGGCPAEPV